MKIIVNDAVGIDEVDVMHEFAVLSALEPAEVGARLEAAQLGRTDATHAWIGVQALRTYAEPMSDDPEWSAAYESMLKYARSKGWWDETSNTIRAHISNPQ